MDFSADINYLLSVHSTSTITCIRQEIWPNLFGNQFSFLNYSDSCLKRNSVEKNRMGLERAGEKATIFVRMVDRCALFRASYVDISSDSSVCDETDHRKPKILYRHLCSGCVHGGGL